MRILVLFVACMMGPLFAHAQLLDRLALDSMPTFRSVERAMKDPLAVYRLDLSGSKLKELPEEIRQMHNLNHLDLGNNKLKVMPEWFKELRYMQELRLSRNKLEAFPLGICEMVHLKRLDMSRNVIEGVPPCIGKLTELFSLDLWSNDLVDFPEEMEQLEALRFLDLRAIQFEVPEMEKIQNLVPRAKVHFSQPCNCGN